MGLGLMSSATDPSVSLTTVPWVESSDVLAVLKPTIRPAAVASGTYPAIALMYARPARIAVTVIPDSQNASFTGPPPRSAVRASNRQNSTTRTVKPTPGHGESSQP